MPSPRKENIFHTLIKREQWSSNCEANDWCEGKLSQFCSFNSLMNSSTKACFSEVSKALLPIHVKKSTSVFVSSLFKYVLTLVLLYVIYSAGVVFPLFLSRNQILIGYFLTCSKIKKQLTGWQLVVRQWSQKSFGQE